MERIVAARGEQAVDVDQVLHVRHLGAEHDPVVRQADLFGERGGAQRRLDHGVEHHVARERGAGERGVGIHHGW